MKTRPFIASVVLANRAILALLLLLTPVSGASAHPAGSGPGARDYPPSVTADSQDAPQLILRGQVLNGRSGLRVQVALPGGGPVVEETYVGPDGGYSFPSLPAGHYELRVVDEAGAPLALEPNTWVEITPEQAGTPVEYILPLVAPASPSESVPAEASPEPVSAEPTEALLEPASTEQSEPTAVIQANGYITGVVTAADTSLPLSSIQVGAYDNSGDWMDTDYTSGTGSYSLTVPAGAYKVEFVDGYGPYAPEWYNNQPNYTSANDVAASAGSVTPNIGAILEVGGQITGQVTAAGTGLPISGASVYAYTSTTSSDYVAYDSTNASGIYEIKALQSGSYYIRFDPPSWQDYLEEYYDDKPSLASANLVNVTLGGVTSGINAALARGGKITGQVTVAGAGTPLSNVYVYAYTSTTSSSWNYVAYDSTDVTGVYTITSLMTGNYYLRFDPPGSDYFEEYYNDKSNLASADPVSVTLGNVTSGINAALARGGKITGQVTAVGTGLPLQNVTVRAYTSTASASWNDVAYDSTDATGVYTITDLTTGNYYLWFDPPGSDYFEEYYNDKPNLASADSVSVTLGGVTSGINAALTLGGKITGQVTAADTNLPLDAVAVTAYNSYGNSVGTDYTDATGVYTLTSLATGNYRLEFRPSSSGAASDYLAEFYNNKANIDTADPVIVTVAQVVSGINASLARGGKITGLVTANDSGLPLKDVQVTVYDCNNFAVGSATTNASGLYTVTALATGSYWVGFNPLSYGAASAYLPEYYNDKSSLATADAVNVTVPGVTSGINAGLERGGQIAGRVTAADTNLPLDDVSIDVYNSNGSYVGFASTDAVGVYTTTALVSGGYRLEFDPYSSSADYIVEYYNDKPDLNTADAINVTAPNVVGGIDAALARGGQITGQVTAGDTNAPLHYVFIDAYINTGASWRYITSASTDASGNYTLKGLKTGSYYLLFDPYSGASADYISEYYNDKASLAAADAVNVTAPGATSGINAVLARGGKITGRVTSEETGTPLEDVYVRAYNTPGSWVASDFTDEMGNYTLSGLPSGDYRVRFSYTTSRVDGCSVIYDSVSEYYNDKPSYDLADVIAVTAPGTVSGIDAALKVPGPVLPLNNKLYLPLIQR